MPLPERREKAVQAALRLLAVKERSSLEIRQRLRQKGYDAETIIHVLDRLQQQGLQDDTRFAETFAESSVRAKGLSGRVIQQELRRRGIDKETAAMAATRSPEEEAETARALARRRVGALARHPAGVQARRLTAFLQRRGYPPTLCAEIVAELCPPGDPDSD